MNENLRKILVFGATGNTGIEICKLLDQSGIWHAAFVRSTSQAKITTTNTKILVGDVLMKDDVNKALKQELFTDVIIALGSRTLKESKVRSIGSKNIVDSLNEHDLSPTLHVISAHGVGDSWGSLKWYEKIVSNLFLKNTMKEHNLQERTITANSNNYHIIRPVALNNDPATKKIVANKDGILPNGSISRADVAYFIIENMFANTRGASSICKE